MSDGLSNLAPPTTVSRNFRGKDYTFSVITLGDIAEKEAFILSLRPNPLAILANVPSNASKEISTLIVAEIVKAAQRPVFVSRDEDAEFSKSPIGSMWLLWRALRDNHDEFGRWSEGKPIGHTVGSGVNKKQYSLTPMQGIQKAAEFNESCTEGEAKSALETVLGKVEQSDALGNSDGPSPTSPSPTTTATPTVESPGA